MTPAEAVRAKKRDEYCFYAKFHPSFDKEEIRSDFNAGIPIAAAFGMRNLLIPIEPSSPRIEIPEVGH